MQKKKIIILIILVIIIIAAFIIIILGKNDSTGNLSWITPDRGEEVSSEVSSEEPEEISIPFNVSGKALQDLMDQDMTDPDDNIYASCEEWVPVTQEGYLNDAELVYNDPVAGEITVGKKGASVAGDYGGIVLNIDCSGPSQYGVWLDWDYGNLGYSDDSGTFCYFFGSAPFTYLGNFDYSTILPGEHCVLLGRTWDQQMKMQYVNDEDFGLCWFYDNTFESLPERVTIEMQLYDLVNRELVGIYDIVLELQDDAYILSNLEPNIPDIPEDIQRDIRSKAVETAAQLLGSEIGSFTETDVILNDVTETQWSETPAIGGGILDATMLPYMGHLVSATVNTHSAVMGPVTIYFIHVVMPSGDLEVENDIRIEAVGYDWLSPLAWNRMVEFNGISDVSITVQNYKPIIATE